MMADLKYICKIGFGIQNISITKMVDLAINGSPFTLNESLRTN